MRTFLISILILVAVVAGGSLIATTAYQAGLSTAVTTVAATAPEGSLVVPVAPGAFPGYGAAFGPWGPGWGAGFSIWGFLATVLVIFLIIGLIRALAFGGRGWGGRRGPGGGWGPGGPGGPEWGHARTTFDTWHRESHESPPTGTTGTTGTLGSTS